MALRDVRVKTGVLADAAEEMGSAAAAIPTAPKLVSAAGTDPLSAAITAHVSSVFPPMIAARPAVKQQASGYAKNVAAAARAYTGTDEQQGGNIDRSMPAVPASG